MPYDLANDPYIDPRFGVLRNKIRAKTQSKLDRSEAEITYIAILTLTKGSNPGGLSFDSNLLCDVHKEIFRDIYDWAGKVRTYDISKDSSHFAHAAFIPKELSRLSAELAQDVTLADDDRPAIIKKLAYYYSEYNAIHPFREGNGRAIRTFLRLLALKYSYDIDWDGMHDGENDSVSETAFAGRLENMEAMLDRITTKIE